MYATKDCWMTVGLSVCLYVCLCVCMYLQQCTRTERNRDCVCMYAYACVCMNAYAYTWTHKHTCNTYAYTAPVATYSCSVYVLQQSLRTRVVYTYCISRYVLMYADKMCWIPAESHTYTHACMHTYLHKHTHANSLALRSSFVTYI